MGLGKAEHPVILLIPSSSFLRGCVDLEHILITRSKTSCGVWIRRTTWHLFLYFSHEINWSGYIDGIHKVMWRKMPPWVTSTCYHKRTSIDLASDNLHPSYKQTPSSPQLISSICPNNPFRPHSLGDQKRRVLVLMAWHTAEEVSSSHHLP